MYDVATEVQSSQTKFGNEEATSNAESVGQEVWNLCSKSKEEIAVDTYCRLRSIELAAEELNISSKRLLKVLVGVRDSRGLEDIRFLYADSEDDFNTGDNDDKAVTQGQLLKLIEKQNFKCALSGIDLVPETAALDHIVPVCDGGEHRIENLQWLDMNVNRMKGRLSEESFIAVCRRVFETSQSKRTHT